jgi:hypothetical protein
MHATAAVLGRALLRRLTDTETLAAHAALLTQVPEPPVESRRVEVPSTRPPDDKAPRIGAIVLAPIFDGLAKRLAERVTVAARALDLTATVHLHSSNKTSSVTTPKLVPHLLELFRLCRKTLAQCAHEVFGRDRVEQIPRALKHRALAKAECCQASCTIGTCAIVGLSLVRILTASWTNSNTRLSGWPSMARTSLSVARSAVVKRPHSRGCAHQARCLPRCRLGRRRSRNGGCVATRVPV